MDPHALRVLEFDRVLSLVLTRAPGTLGRQYLGNLTPSSVAEEVRTRQRETVEMRLLVEGEGLWSWGGSEDVSEELESLRADNSWIDPPRLLRIARFVDASHRIKKYIAKEGPSCPELTRIAATIPDFPLLSEKITQCISHDGEVLDGASAGLARIRKELDQARRDIMSSLEKFFHRSEQETAVQEKIITRRNERYVIPVKSGSRGAIPGLVHDRSASGQTLFVEPEGVVEKNNRLRECLAEEREEILRILRKLASLVRDRRDDLAQAMAGMGTLEGIWARAVFSVEFDLTKPELFDEEGKIELRGARHPLLQMTIGNKVVPFDFILGRENRTLVMTGPNTGGKTVALKTVGLLCLMAQSGMQIPALPGSGLSCFTEVLADIGDEQSIHQNLSTFSGHMKNVIAILERSAPGALILLDELGAGTDPSEGAALGIAILEVAHAGGALTIATTHHNAVKVFAADTTGVANASMEFDGETLEPTYRLVMGIPGRSQAFHIASHLGMKKEIIDRARRYQSAGEVRLDRLMADLEREREDVVKKKHDLETTQRQREREDEARRRKWEKKLDKMERKGWLVVQEAEREITSCLRRMKQEKDPGAIESATESIGKVRKVLSRYSSLPAAPEVDVGSLSIGDRVFLRTLRAWGTLEEHAKDRVVVRVKGRRCAVPLVEIEKREEAPSSGRGGELSSGSRYKVDVPVIEAVDIDLRGLRAEEALARLDRFLEHALLNNLQEITIIHGKGSGRLQEAVANYLSEHSRVERFESAPLEQGGSGVTRARLSV